jgi:D-lactate dehydrogenase
MRIAVFSTKTYDHTYLDLANQEHHHELTYFEPRLSATTAPLAHGHDVVCIFVNDVADAETLQVLAAGGTKLLALRCAGFNQVDVAAANAAGIRVARVPAYSPYAVAEHTLALILALNRKIHRAYNRVREMNFSIEGLLGFDLHGKTAGVIGTGKIGELVAKLLVAFGCRVLAYDVQQNPEVSGVGCEYVSLDELLAQSDIITLHCPLVKATYHLIGPETIGKMKPGVMIINTSRGGLVDTPAVIQGLKEERIGYLGLDVYEEESEHFFDDHSGDVLKDDTLARLLTFPNVLVTGHQAFFTKNALENISHTTLGNVTAFAKGEALVNEVKP